MANSGSDLLNNSPGDNAIADNNVTNGFSTRSGNDLLSNVNDEFLPAAYIPSDQNTPITGTGTTANDFISGNQGTNVAIGDPSDDLVQDDEPVIFTFTDVPKENLPPSFNERITNGSAVQPVGTTYIDSYLDPETGTYTDRFYDPTTNQIESISDYRDLGNGNHSYSWTYTPASESLKNFVNNPAPSILNGANAVVDFAKANPELLTQLALSTIIPGNGTPTLNADNSKSGSSVNIPLTAGVGAAALTLPLASGGGSLLTALSEAAALINPAALFVGTFGTAYTAFTPPVGVDSDKPGTPIPGITIIPNGEIGGAASEFLGNGTINRYFDTKPGFSPNDINARPSDIKLPNTQTETFPQQGVFNPNNINVGQDIGKVLGDQTIVDKWPENQSPQFLEGRRDIYMGKNPTKDSSIGSEVIERMKTEGTIRQNDQGKLEVLSSEGKWHDIDKTDMSHIVDAVTWWNNVGYKSGPRSEKVREFMNDPNNYTLEPSGSNRSRGGSTTERYRHPE